MPRISRLTFFIPVFAFAVAFACGTPIFAEEAVLSGTALGELDGTPPEPPAGFATKELAMAGILTGKVKIIDKDPAVPEDVEIIADVQYGTGGGTPLALDLYRPKNLSQPVPALVFIHGGAWSKGKRTDYRLYGIDFAKRGYVVASVSYRLTNVAPFPAAVQDVKCAVRFLRANAAKYGIDPDKIAAAGGSAGGHLALMVGYSSGVPELEGDGGNAGVSSRVQAVVDLYGPVDLTTEFAQAASPVKRFMANKTYKEAREMYEQASPIVHVSADDPPTLILHGTIDEVVPIVQSDMLAEKLKETGVPYIYDRLPGWTHAMDVSQSVNERCQWLMERFFARYVPLPQK